MEIDAAGVCAAGELFAATQVAVVDFRVSWLGAVVYLICIEMLSTHVF